ncbi:MAG: hypothetical protein KDA29_14590 [Phycisphaerales bacterium]|nr:hypothetical protein [Phycisphaerales bacterium]
MFELGKGYKVGDYHPYWIYTPAGKEHNPAFDNHSDKVLDLKKPASDYRRGVAVDYFFSLMNPKLPPGLAVCFVPSSDPKKRDTGMRDLARRLAAADRLDATDCLIRSKAIPALHSGGNRSFEVQLASLRVDHADLIKSQDVVVLDDVRTSGNSLTACRMILLDAGAKSVTTIAMGKTTHA